MLIVEHLICIRIQNYYQITFTFLEQVRLFHHISGCIIYEFLLKIKWIECNFEGRKILFPWRSPLREKNFNKSRPKWNLSKHRIVLFINFLTSCLFPGMFSVKNFKFTGIYVFHWLCKLFLCITVNYLVC